MITKPYTPLLRVKHGTTLAAVILCSALAGPLFAGGGPENVFLVVNSQSWQSKTVANHFAQLRKIPARNICYIPWSGSLRVPAPVNDFRTKILLPVLTAMAQRGIAGQIDYIIYSSEFPETIDLKSDFGGKKLPNKFLATASITGLTYYYQRVLSRDPGMVNVRTNQYMRFADSALRGRQPYGFSSWRGWAAGGTPQPAGGEHYMLSMMLAVTKAAGTRANTIDEVIRYLTRSAKADGTHPRGTIYYVKNSNIRSTTRESTSRKINRFSDAVARLRTLGVNAQVISGTIPTGKTDVMGAMVGTAKFKWSTSGSRILPGAICEHLTSFGGVLQRNTSQTPLTEFLRYGAAGASGTVVEPYAIQNKFPHPMIHVYYAQGCTLAETFYQSVFGPYQLLIVGDPLCRPWANIPRVSVTGITPGEKLQGTVKLTPSAQFPRRGVAGHYELFVDGRRHSKCKAQSAFSLNTAELSDGYHELRVVAIEQGPIESQGRWISPITVDNHGSSIAFSSAPGRSLRWGQSLYLTAKATGADKIVLRQNHQVLLGTIDGAEGRLRIDSKILGQGPVMLYATALKIVDNKPRIVAAAKPIRLSVSGSTP